MGTLPILLKNQDVLLVGGGPVALQKAKVLLNNGVPFTLIAPEICSELDQLGIKISKKQLSTEDLKNVTILVDATGNTAVAEMILTEKKRHFFLYNCVDQPKLCDFYFSSLLNYGDLKIAVSTNGCSPALGQVIRDKIATIIPTDIESLLKRTGQDRNQGVINSVATKKQCQKLLTTIYLIGCGSGEIDLLTLKAYRTIQQIDVVFYDHRITQEILDLLPPAAKRISVERLDETKINELIYQEASSGLGIAHLKRGAPYSFGHGVDEADYFIKRGIKVVVINGVNTTAVKRTNPE